jgi:hypothetical protein
MNSCNLSSMTTEPIAANSGTVLIRQRIKIIRMSWEPSRVPA